VQNNCTGVLRRERLEFIMKKKALSIALTAVLLAASAMAAAQGLPRADPRDARRGGGPDLDQYPAHSDSRADRDRRSRHYENRADRRRADGLPEARKRDRKHERRHRDRSDSILPEILGGDRRN